MMQAGLRLMLPRRTGAIVNTASTAALRAAKGYAPYTAAKGGLVALTALAGAEYAEHGIRINAIAPGSFNTSIRTATDEELTRRASTIPMGRFGEPREVAALARFLVSDDAAYITGQTYVIDGGATITMPV
jgi:3-oxoacyl-[acyl-carrier protein] reductase